MARDRPLRLLVLLQHAGYLRHYAEPVRILATRGHSIHVALGVDPRDDDDAALVDELAAHAGVTVGRAPARDPEDPWRPLAWLVRAFADLSRYTDPRFAGATALRNRVADTIQRELRAKGGRGGGATAWTLEQTLGRLTRHIASSAGARTGRRLTRLFLLLDCAIPSSPAIEAYLREVRPDAVLVSPLVDIGSPQSEYLKSARALGIPAALCVASWDNLSNKGLVKPQPDRVIVWNEIQRREAAELHRIRRTDVVVTGAQRFDQWFERAPSTTPAVFRAAVGLADGPYVLYLCSSRFIAGDETSFVRYWARALRESDFEELASLGILIRPHPQNAAPWAEANFGDLVNAVVWPRHGEHPDRAEARATFYDSIAHSVAVVGLNTSALIEATILGKGTYTLLDPSFAGTQAGTLHFHYLLHENGGVLRTAQTLEEHHSQLIDALRGGAGDEERFRGFLERFVRPGGLDRPAAPGVADAMAAVAAAAPAPERDDLALRIARGALAPAAAVSRLAFGRRR